MCTVNKFSQTNKYGINSPPGSCKELILNFVSILFFPVSCVDLDGDAGTMPIIFEDVYKDDEQANEHSKRRRHSFSKYRDSSNT